MPATSTRVPAAALWILATLAVVAFLRLASELLIPIVLSVLLSYAFEPLVERLERLHLPRVIGAGVLLLALVSGAGWGMYSMRGQVQEVIEALPRAVQRVGQMMGLARESVDGVRDAAVSTSTLFAGAGWIAEAAGQLTVIVFLTYFLLIAGDHFKRRLVEIVGPGLEKRQITVQVLQDINDQIKRYLFVLLITSSVVAAATWVVLAWMGVRQAPVWAILAGAFNSIPYFGPVIVSGGLLAVAFMQFGDPSMAFQVAAATLAITSLEGWLLTPLLMGKFERMHAVVIFVGVLVWTWLWGGWGTVLAVPMLAVVKAVCDHVKPLTPVSRLLAQ